MPTASVANTTIGPIAFGSRWREMMRGPDAPAARAASTYSFSRNDRNSPRTMRAIAIQPSAARMMIMPGTVGGRREVEEPEERRIRVLGHDEQHGERGDHEQEIGEPHQDTVDPAAVEPGQRADRDADHAPRASATPSPTSSDICRP